MTDLTERLRTTRLLSQRNQLALQEEAATTLETLTQENARLRLIVQVIADADSEDCVGSLDVDIPSGGYPRQWLRDAARKELGGDYADQR